MTFIFTQVCVFFSTMNMLQKSYEIVYIFCYPLPALMRRYLIGGKCRYFWTAPYKVITINISCLGPCFVEHITLMDNLSPHVTPIITQLLWISCLGRFILVFLQVVLDDITTRSRFWMCRRYYHIDS